MCGPKFCSMKITQDVRGLCGDAERSDGVGMSMSGTLEDGLPTDSSAVASAKAEALAQAGMATMSQKFKDMGGQVYLDAEKVEGEQSGIVRSKGIAFAGMQEAKRPILCSTLRAFAGNTSPPDMTGCRPNGVRQWTMRMTYSSATGASRFAMHGSSSILFPDLKLIWMKKSQRELTGLQQEFFFDQTDIEPAVRLGLPSGINGIEPGGLWRNKLKEAIRRSKCMVGLWSPTYLSPRGVRPNAVALRLASIGRRSRLSSL